MGGVRLIQVPAERPVGQRLGGERAQRDRQRARRQGRHEALEREGPPERGAVALVEGGVAAQRVVAALLPRDDRRDLVGEVVWA